MHFTICHRGLWKIFCLLIILNLILLVSVICHHKNKKGFKLRTTENPRQRKFCLKIERTLHAQHKSCFLRPDTGPCRADIIQWYYDVKQTKCYRFYWGGCQGNGNRFESYQQCTDYCHLNPKKMKKKIPHFCSLGFEYGQCFGHFNRFAWDTRTKTCRRHMYSGCGGNQNNFQSRLECMNTCLNPPNNTMDDSHHFTTCIPIIMPEMN